MQRPPKALILSRLLRILFFISLVCTPASAQKSSTTSLGSTDRRTLKGVVLDPAGAVVSHARVQILDAGGESVIETLSQSDGTFEITSPVIVGTLAVSAQGFGRFRKELDLGKSPGEKLEVRLTIDCSADIKEVIPKKLDLRNFLLEIHHYGAFGDCPEKTYRLWGTGEASVTYRGCGGKTFRNTRFIEGAVLTPTLAELAKKHSTPVCDYYAGGIDAAGVQLTIFSGYAPRILISHDEGDEIQSLSELERQLEKLIDPEDRMRSFATKANKPVK